MCACLYKFLEQGLADYKRSDIVHPKPAPSTGGSPRLVSGLFSCDRKLNLNVSCFTATFFNVSLHQASYFESSIVDHIPRHRITFQSTLACHGIAGQRIPLQAAKSRRDFVSALPAMASQCQLLALQILLPCVLQRLLRLFFRFFALDLTDWPNVHQHTRNDTELSLPLHSTTTPTGCLLNL